MLRPTFWWRFSAIRQRKSCWRAEKILLRGRYNIPHPSYTQVWTCPFNRDDLLRIWAQNDATSLTTDDEKRAFKLLTSYNGTCPVRNSFFPSWMQSRPTVDKLDASSGQTTDLVLGSSKKLGHRCASVTSLLPVSEAHQTAPIVAGKVFKWGRAQKALTLISTDAYDAFNGSWIW